MNTVDEWKPCFGHSSRGDRISTSCVSWITRIAAWVLSAATSVVIDRSFLTHYAGLRILERLESRNLGNESAIPGGRKMHTKDAIQFALTVSNGAVLSAIDEMSGAATTFPTPNGGCHPLWVLGSSYTG